MIPVMEHSAQTTAPAHNMRQIMELRDQRQKELLHHSFFDWLRSPDVPLEKKFDILPVLVLFVMNFRDMNLWVIRFEEADDVFKQTINGSTTEDETHSRMFLEDWRKLHLDDRLGWNTTDLLWWLFLAEEMEEFRELGAEFVRLCVDDGGDPLVRFAHSEAAEACGNVFFTVAAPLADALGERRNVVYRYLGTFHLDLETGHVLHSEDVFQDQPLTEAQHTLGVALLHRMFHVFERIYDVFLRYATRYVDEDRTPRLQPFLTYTDPDNEASSSQIAPSASFGEVHPSQQPLQDLLQTRMAQAAQHPFFDWLRQPEPGALQKLQRFIPFWAFDALGYRDLNHYFLRYDQPEDELERSVNAIADTLSTHSQLFLQDWQALRLDEQLRWPASDALGFFFLDHVTDHHRKTLLTFGIEALKHPHPLDRLWLIEALEATGHEFFARTRDVALLAEEQASIRLDYFADRHATVSPPGAVRPVNFKAVEVRDPQRLAAARRLVGLVFDALDRNLALSLQQAESNRLAIR